MKLRLDYWSAEAKRTTGRRFSLTAWANAAGLYPCAVRVAKHRGRLGMYTAGKLAEALSLEIGRKVYWFELYDKADNPALEYIRAEERRKSAKGKS